MTTQQLTTVANQMKAALAAKAAVTPTTVGKLKITKPNVFVDRDAKENTMTFTVDLNGVSMRGNDVNVSEQKVDDKTGKTSGGNVILAGYYDKLSGIPIGVLGGEQFDVRVNFTITLIQPTSSAKSSK